MGLHESMRNMSKHAYTWVSMKAWNMGFRVGLHEFTHDVAVLVDLLDFGPDSVQVFLWVARHGVMGQVPQNAAEAVLVATQVEGVHHVGHKRRDADPGNPEDWMPVWVRGLPCPVRPHRGLPSRPRAAVRPWAPIIRGITPAQGARLECRGPGKLEGRTHVLEIAFQQPEDPPIPPGQVLVRVGPLAQEQSFQAPTHLSPEDAGDVKCWMLHDIFGEIHVDHELRHDGRALANQRSPTDDGSRFGPCPVLCHHRDSIAVQ